MLLLLLMRVPVKDLVAGSSITFEDLGPHTLVGVPGRWQLFAAVPD
jgi:hypothetical protein